MDEERRAQLAAEPLGLYGYLTLLLILVFCFGVFYISPARLIFNAFFYHNVECTVDSAWASSSSGSVASRSYRLHIETTDCGKLYKRSNGATDKQAERLNEMKGEKITVRMGYLPWGIDGKLINFIVEPEYL